MICLQYVKQFEVHLAQHIAPIRMMMACYHNCEIILGKLRHYCISKKYSCKMEACNKHTPVYKFTKWFQRFVPHSMAPDVQGAWTQEDTYFDTEFVQGIYCAYMSDTSEIRKRIPLEFSPQITHFLARAPKLIFSHLRLKSRRKSLKMGAWLPPHQPPPPHQVPPVAESQLITLVGKICSNFHIR